MSGKATDRELRLLPQLRYSWLGQGMVTGAALGVVIATAVVAVKPVVADVYFKRALIAESAGRRAEAAALLDKAVGAEPANDFYVNQLGQTYFTGVEDNNALWGMRGLSILARAQAMNPLQEYYYLDLGRANLALFQTLRNGRYLSDARRWLERGKGLDPHFTGMRLELARVYRLMGDKKRAAAEARGAKSMSPVGY